MLPFEVIKMFGRNSLAYFESLKQRTSFKKDLFIYLKKDGSGIA